MTILPSPARTRRWDSDDSLDATGRNPALSDDDATQLASLDDPDEDTDVGLDTSLLDATGQTQILTEDMAVDTATGVDTQVISDDDKTMLRRRIW